MKFKEKGKNQIRPLTIVPVVTNNKYIALSFVFPFVILGTVFALNKVFPFGNRHIIINDLFHQHYPFLNGFWHKLREGGISQWSWAAGAGHDYIAVIAYYLASPLNWLVALTPHAWLRETLTLALLVKIGCAGLFTGMFLRYAFKQDTVLAKGAGMALPVFSSLYALCAFTLGFFSTTIWFDSFALLPLVMHGLFALMKEGKYRLYVISLALAVFTNFYMGLYICIFVALTFFIYCIIQKLKGRDFLRKLGLIAVCSILAIGMTAALTIPSLLNLQNIFKQENGMFPDNLILYESFFNLLGNFIAFSPPTFLDGTPNLYCGMISVLLAGFFAASKKVSFREKATLLGTIVFMFISCNLHVLNYIWNGFRYPYSLPGRFTFLISFALVVIAYRAFLLAEGINWQSLLIMGASAVLFLVSAVFGPQGKNAIIGSSIFCAFYLLLFYLYGAGKEKIQQFARAALLLLVITELSITSWVAIKTVNFQKRDDYPDHYEQIQAILAKRQPAGNNFYRTEIDQFYTSMDPYVYNYDGISFFSTTIDFGVCMFIRELGLQTSSNYLRYSEATPLASAFLNLRYLISCEEYPAIDSAYWKNIAKAGDALLFENKYYLPLGFMVNTDLTNYVYNSKNSFFSQNNLFRRATGLDGSLFMIKELEKASASKTGTQGKITWECEIPFDGVFYVHCRSEEKAKVDVSVNGNFFQNLYILGKSPYVSKIASLSKNDIISFTSESDMTIFIGRFNTGLFEQGYKLLFSQTLNLTKFTDTYVCGNITVLNGGLLYTSIPANKNWDVFVDGKKSRIIPIGKAMIAIHLNNGYHEIEFRYFNKSFMAGIIVSLVSLGLFIILITFKKRSIL